MAKNETKATRYSGGSNGPALGGLARAIARVAANDAAARDVVNVDKADPSQGVTETFDDVVLLTVREASSRLSTSDDIVRQLLRDKKIEGTKVGGAWRISQTAITDFLILRLARP